MNRKLIAGLAACVALAPPGAPATAQDPATAAQPTPPCAAGLTATERRALDWQTYEFAQTPGLPMELASRRCFAEAAAASRDYLAFGPLLTTRQQAITTFHMGRNLAYAGREAEAAVAVAASRRSDQVAGGLDWNAYVRGVYAFLTKDAATLDMALATLRVSASESDRTNAANLTRLKACFSKSYITAMNAPACAAAADIPAH